MGRGIGIAFIANEKHPMELNLDYYTLDHLEQLLARADSDLRKALINGERWEKISLKQDLITKVALEIHKRRYPFGGTPAEKPLRGHDSMND